MTDNRADELMHDLLFIDCIDTDWLSDTRDEHRLLQPENLARLGRIVEALDEIDREAKTKGFAEVIEQAALERRAIESRIPFRIGFSLISEDPFERDLARVRYEIGEWAEATSIDERGIIQLARCAGFEVRDLAMTSEGSPTPCFIGRATFKRDGEERAIDIPPVVVGWEPDELPHGAPPPSLPLAPEDYGDPSDLPF